VVYTGTSSGNVTCDSLGNYVIPGLSNGTYLVTPDVVPISPDVFVPTSRTVEISGADVTGVDFTIAAPPSPGGGSGLGFDFRFRF
jgi:hypothetical protein